MQIQKIFFLKKYQAKIYPIEFTLMFLKSSLTQQVHWVDLNGFDSILTNIFSVQFNLARRVKSTGQSILLALLVGSNSSMYIN